MTFQEFQLNLTLLKWTRTEPTGLYGLPPAKVTAEGRHPVIKHTFYAPDDTAKIEVTYRGRKRQRIIWYRATQFNSSKRLLYRVGIDIYSFGQALRWMS